MEEKKQKFIIELGEFNGPLDLLLDLIKQKKMKINDVSLAEISNNYISFVRENEFRLTEATSFLSVAATLMLIKSRALLPKIIFEKEDEEDIDDLKKRLLVLREFKKISQRIKQDFGQKILYKKIFKRQVEIKFRPDESLKIENLLKEIDELFSSIKIKEKKVEKKVEKQISLKEITEIIYNKLVKYFKMTFDEVAVAGDKKQKAASFIAILELFRNGKVNLKQQRAFGQINIEKTEPGLIYKE